MDNNALVWLLIVCIAVGISIPVYIKYRRSREGFPFESIENKTPQEITDITAYAEKKNYTEEEERSDISLSNVNDIHVPEVPYDQPEHSSSRLKRLRERLVRSGSFGKNLLAVLSRGDLSEEDWEECEEILLLADVGMDVTQAIVENVRSRVLIEDTKDKAVIKELLKQELLTYIDGNYDRSLHIDDRLEKEGTLLPASILMVGVNGTGKTTTTGKLARVLVADGKTVLLGAADTFRAAAADQLVTWGQRVNVDVIRSDVDDADPASVAFDAMKEGSARNVDVVLVDTAGRLQNKTGLMDELAKIKRVMEKTAPVNEVLLVLDATTGQNGLKQAEAFSRDVGVTGIVLTKLDGSAKGGIILQVQKLLGVPVKYIGLGEGVDDLAPFDAHTFVDSLLDS
ncbi:MAG: signal recognition particle-docking protein FtsY [Actinomycetaceae bacterium]|nr:signal recognition particle-docking protein FtsY [Actinomycetaceae bacterium]